MVLGSWVCPVVRGGILVSWCYLHLALHPGIPHRKALESHCESAVARFPIAP